jgi:Ricin-type beta-trefoil lectin domain-like
VTISFSMYTPDPEGWLDVPGSSLESGIQIQAYPTFHGGANQQWNLLPAPMAAGDDRQYFQIQSVASNLLLTLDGGRTDERTPVIQLEDVGDDQQLWTFNVYLDEAWVSGL